MVITACLLNPYASSLNLKQSDNEFRSMDMSFQ